jgi:hypothetical protein
MINKQALLFLKKKKQQDFWSLAGMALHEPHPPRTKSFLVIFFQTSNVLLSPLPVTIRA